MPPAKGGVWTNIEDEILKAAISKYGLNQWARVSSLLARKTAKQCKARWSEWLDPGIRKVEWSRDEDEKLLHLAKLMPTQWRTIAPIVGRTATQCLERYQKLLDEAEARDTAQGEGLMGPDGGETSAPTADDVRRLRPGELDPDPESKPAKPDTVDLDEDEKEMLSEARARLANTQGKKAKRKARERQLEESRRVALLQKRRELKNAGINIRITKQKRGEMDYNADIPFEKAPAPGFYDTVEEEEKNEKQREAFDPRKKQLELKRKGDPEDDLGNEQKKRKGDTKTGEGISAAAAKAAQMQKIREAEMKSKRRALVLPAPQVSEGELEEIVKMGRSGERATQHAGVSENESTRGLVSNYHNMMGATPIRTPRVAQEDDRLANEIRNAIARTESQSALLGGEDTVLYGEDKATGYNGVLPSKQQMQTPNPLATPLRNGNSGMGSQHANGASVGSTPLRTPRDGFNLNKATGLPVSQTPQDVRRYEKLQRTSLANQLAALPRPKENDWEFELPDEQQAEVSTQLTEEDAAVRDRRNERLRKEAELAMFRRQSQVVQRGLSRPAVININELTKAARSKPDQIASSVALEAVSLLANDAIKYGGSRVVGTASPVSLLDDLSMQKARDAVREELGDVPVPIKEDAPPLMRSLNVVGVNALDDGAEELGLCHTAFDTVQGQITASASRANAQEKKLGKLLGGYQQRSKTLRKRIVDAAGALEERRVELSALRTVHGLEQAAVHRRLERLREEVAFVSGREREAQDEYRRGRDELGRLEAHKVNGVH